MKREGKPDKRESNDEEVRKECKEKEKRKINRKKIREEKDQ